MANANQLAMLKNDVQRWNIWRTPFSLRSVSMPEDIDLQGADLRGAKLVDAELRAANFIGSNLSGADLKHANLKGARFKGANLSRANLSYANLDDANLNEADLSEANLSGASFFQASLKKVNASKAKLQGAKFMVASLDYADLSDADLCGADLRSADLNGARLVRTNLSKSNLLCARVGNTVFGNLDLSLVNRLKDVIHDAPSIIGIDTIAKSKGNILGIFLKGCGLSDWEIEEASLYNPALSNEEVRIILDKIYNLRASQEVQVSPLYISYSPMDRAFVDALVSKLDSKGIRFWRDIRDMKSGPREKQIDIAIRQNPTMLLVLSKHSLNNDWVVHEVREARKLEKEMGRDVLCPVTLDDSWESSSWEQHIMDQVKKYNILDFSKWEDDTEFEGMFHKLIDGLQLFYKDKAHGE